MSFSFGSELFANATVVRVVGLTTLTKYKFQFEVKLEVKENRAQERTTLRDLRGELSINNRGTSYYLERLWTTASFSSLYPLQNSFSSSVWLECYLDQEQIEVIEDIRRGGRIEFHFNLIALLSHPSRGEQVVSYGQTLQVALDDWLKVLDIVAYSKNMLLEIPVLDAGNDPRFKKPGEHLIGSQKAIFEGRYQDAVGQCRLALDNLRTILGDPEVPKNVDPKTLIDNRKDGDKAHRYHMMRRAAFYLCSASLHSDEHTANIEWTRSDAIAILSMVGAIIKASTQPEKNGLE